MSVILFNIRKYILLCDFTVWDWKAVRFHIHVCIHWPAIGAFLDAFVKRKKKKMKLKLHIVVHIQREKTRKRQQRERREKDGLFLFVVVVL